MTSEMNLKTMFITEDASTPEQKVFNVWIVFDKKDGGHAAYELEFLSGMHLEDFQQFFAAIGFRMQAEGPHDCEMDVANL